MAGGGKEEEEEEKENYIMKMTRVFVRTRVCVHVCVHVQFLACVSLPEILGQGANFRLYTICKPYWRHLERKKTTAISSYAASMSHSLKQFRMLQDIS